MQVQTTECEISLDTLLFFSQIPHIYAIWLKEPFRAYQKGRVLDLLRGGGVEAALAGIAGEDGWFLANPRKVKIWKINVDGE